MGQCLKKQILVCKFEVQNLLNRGTDKLFKLLSDSHCVEVFQIFFLRQFGDGFSKKRGLLIKLEDILEDPVPFTVIDEEWVWVRVPDRMSLEILLEDFCHVILHLESVRVKITAHLECQVLVRIDAEQLRLFHWHTSDI